MITLQKSLNSLIITGLLFISPIYTNTLVRAQSSQTSISHASTKTLIKDELYFGLSKPGGKTVSEVEWQLFLNRVITPRLPDGLTVMDVYGQYLDSSGKLTREKTKLVILIYENSQTKNQKIEEIIASYKKTFQQESVLRVTSSVRVSF
jgi:5-methylcytosine-specific restriction endonuclease McrBC regulatory subunit McrC